MSSKQIAEVIGLKPSSVTYIWHRAGLHGKTKYVYGIQNQDYFKVIDTPDKAYFLGFICSDGCIYYDKNHPKQPVLRISISRNDEHILDQFKKFIMTEKPISRTNGKYSTLELSSSEIVESIESHGIGARKTWSNCIPNDIPDNLMKYFIRGYFDGDGAISKKVEKNSLHNVGISISGYYGNLTKIIDILANNNIFSVFCEDKRKYSDGYGPFGLLTFTNKISKYCFLKYIYDDLDCPYLFRKYKLAKEFIDVIEQDDSIMERIAVVYYNHAVCCV